MDVTAKITGSSSYLNSASVKIARDADADTDIVKNY